MDNTIIETVRALEALLAQHHRRLEGNPDYKAVQTLERSIRELKASTAIPAAVSKPLPPARVNGSSSLSQPAAAETIILARGEPVNSNDLVDEIQAMGVHIGGANKRRNLGSMLSNNKKFVSVPWKSGTAWWLTGRDVPKGDSLV